MFDLDNDILDYSVDDNWHDNDHVIRDEDYSGQHISFKGISDESEIRHIKDEVSKYQYEVSVLKGEVHHQEIMNDASRLSKATSDLNDAIDKLNDAQERLNNAI